MKRNWPPATTFLPLKQEIDLRTCLSQEQFKEYGRDNLISARA